MFNRIRCFNNDIQINRLRNRIKCTNANQICYVFVKYNIINKNRISVSIYIYIYIYKYIDNCTI